MIAKKPDNSVVLQNESGIFLGEDISIWKNSSFLNKF